jgi:hypothetical protein
MTFPAVSGDFDAKRSPNLVSGIVIWRGKRVSTFFGPSMGIGIDVSG